MKDETMLMHILEKLEKTREDIGDIKASQARMEVDVRHHIKRTDLLEETVKELKKIVDWLAAPVYLVRWVLKQLGLMK
jgi:hypothetical protein